MLARLLLLGVAASASASAAPKRDAVVEEVKVGDFAMIVFSPPESSVPAAVSDSERSAMRFHVGNALAIASECLRPRGVDAVLVEADVIEIESGSRSWRLEASADGVQGVGAYLVRPAESPRLVRCTSGPSALQFVLPVFGSRYLGFPECVPEEWRTSEVSDAC